MCWRCDEPEPVKHDRHYWSAKETLHATHVVRFELDCIDRNLSRFGMKRLDFSKLAKFLPQEIGVQPMTPVRPFLPFAPKIEFGLVEQFIDAEFAALDRTHRLHDAHVVESKRVLNPAEQYLFGIGAPNVQLPSDWLQ